MLQGHNLTQNELDTQGGNSVVAILTKLLDDQDVEIRTKVEFGRSFYYSNLTENISSQVAEGLCKLLMIDAISSSKMFQRLIYMWFNPLADGDGKLRHVLGTFFPLYASMARAHQDSIEEAFYPTLRTLFEAPVTSPLAEINVEDVGVFMVQLTREDFLQVKFTR